MLILSITETGARLIQPDWTMNPLGNWWFGVAIAVLFTGLGLDRDGSASSPRGSAAWHGDGPRRDRMAWATQLTPAERRGLRAAGLVALAVVVAVRRAVALAGLHAALRRGSCTGPALDAAVSRA